MKKKLFAVSDVHGYYDQLVSALAEAGFDENNEEHLLICCGDCFDRGQQNYEVLKFFERCKNAILIKGNHEELLLRALYKGQLEWNDFFNGTAGTIVEFFGKYSVDQNNYIDFSGNNRTADRLISFAEEMSDYFETENYVFTHGWLPTRMTSEGRKIDERWRSASKRSWSDARWESWVTMYRGCNRLEGKTIVCGHHTAMDAYKFDSKRSPLSSEIFYGDGVIAIDACTDKMKRVNVLVLEDNLL